MSEIVAVYADGGVIERNPSPYGGTWAYCHIDKEGNWVRGKGGVIKVPGTSNNVSEFVAIVEGLDALPDGWSGTLYSDSQVSLGRFFSGWALKGIPRQLIDRGGVVLRRMGHIEPVLLQGHPTRAELERGIGNKHGYPVSRWNCWCDRTCTKLAREYMQPLRLVSSANQA